jgi:hypothetical protein
MTKRTNWKLVRKRFGEHVNKYHLALGRFVSAFSQAEATLLCVLWALARVRPPYAQAVLSGIRIDGAMGFINRIAEAERWPAGKREKWQRIFTQLGLINKLRNDLLHHGAGIFGDFWVVSNRRIAHHPDRLREIHITPSTLDDAAADLGDITYHLILLAGRRTGIWVSDRQKLARRLRRRAWRYKQPPQADYVRMMDQILQSQPPPASGS